jgi:hypothetical protein
LNEATTVRADAVGNEGRSIAEHLATEGKLPLRLRAGILVMAALCAWAVVGGAGYAIYTLVS